ncbi:MULTISPECIES: DUF1080 domain-containing protein [unclassified Micromonospora]|uniref:DUF1080 domain-containing protein n=1 Tax=unclassified Micromonospora TaxID=2617518 RepID=UPI001C23F1A8|nr:MULTISPECIES: DUF1080 domain-containing protein [unclassified Micromonospora]MBU8855830.1 DUF1080 domain-containing protein [Micromonospora sp. WMMB482]MBU8861850.1 DUF1080 domain-containing protein [Micromonospora sp. WMMB482]MDM4781430.1 hypothetical protein [Micromonospora sp. b486]
MSLRCNGVPVHDDTEVTGPRGGGAAETATGGRLRLQDHGDPGADVRQRSNWREPLT